MKETSLFNENALQKMKKIRKIFLNCAVWILVAELIVGAILIIIGTDTWNITIGKIQGTFMIIALILFISINNFIRIEKGNKLIQTFASISFISNLIWGILALLLIWEILPTVWSEYVATEFFGTTFSTTHPTVYSIIALTAAYAAAAGFWISNIMSIKETVKAVKPLKVASIVCIAYLWFSQTLLTIFQPLYSEVEKLYQLSGLAGLAFIVMALAALIVSKTNKNKIAEPSLTTKNETQTQPASKTDAEIRAEIEEKVRREMIEKEVRAKLEAEQANAEPNNNVENSEPTNPAEPIQS